MNGFQQGDILYFCFHITMKRQYARGGTLYNLWIMSGMHVCVCKFNHLDEITLCLGKGPVRVVIKSHWRDARGWRQQESHFYWQLTVPPNDFLEKLGGDNPHISQADKSCFIYWTFKSLLCLLKANRNYIHASLCFRFCLVDWENLKTNTSLFAKTVSIKNN